MLHVYEWIGQKSGGRTFPNATLSHFFVLLVGEHLFRPTACSKLSSLFVLIFCKRPLQSVPTSVQCSKMCFNYFHECWRPFQLRLRPDAEHKDSYMDARVQTSTEMTRGFRCFALSMFAFRTPVIYKSTSQKRIFDIFLQFGVMPRKKKIPPEAWRFAAGTSEYEYLNTRGIIWLSHAACCKERTTRRDARKRSVTQYPRSNSRGQKVFR